MENIRFIPVTTEENIAQIEDLGAKIWNEHYIKILSQDQIDYMLEKFQSKASIKKQIDENYKYYLIEHDAENVGYLALLPKENHMFLSKLYIKAEKRGQGIGKKAFNFINAKCIDKGHKSIKLTVNKYNVSSVEAYKKIGFKITEPIITEVGNGYIMDDYNMEYKLD